MGGRERRESGHTDARDERVLSSGVSLVVCFLLASRDEQYLGPLWLDRGGPFPRIAGEAAPRRAASGPPGRPETRGTVPWDFFLVKFLFLLAFRRLERLTRAERQPRGQSCACYVVSPCQGVKSRAPRRVSRISVQSRTQGSGEGPFLFLSCNLAAACPPVAPGTCPGTGIFPHC